MEYGVFYRIIEGFSAVGLRSRQAELLMVPQLGGRIVSLVGLKSGREWLWHREKQGWLWENNAGDDFALSPQAGIDECIPTVAPCCFKGRLLPDHGEVWYKGWELDSSALARGVICSRVVLDVSPFVFERCISIDSDGSFLLDYKLENWGIEDEPFIWSLHPLKSIKEGDYLVLPDEIDFIRLDGGLGVPIQRGDVWAYPEPFSGIRLDRLQVPGDGSELCVKGFAGPLKHGWASVCNDNTADSIKISWDADVIPYLGIWINRGLGGAHHVGLEPCTGIPDSLAIAANEWKTVETIAPSQKLRWRIKIEIL
ncbi:hypothetical protein WKV44_05335 [Spirochaetia bacterium 38H-sp]|uniref:DUF4432 family protein n=1 Tax=Rarispira pelagica TaxID=3141764 RepID=A0ABU9UBB5_9SPIR